MSARNYVTNEHTGSLRPSPVTNDDRRTRSPQSPNLVPVRISRREHDMLIVLRRLHKFPLQLASIPASVLDGLSRKKDRCHDGEGNS